MADVKPPKAQSQMITQDGVYRHILALIVVAGCFITMGVLLFFPIPNTNKDIVNFALGLIIGASLNNVIRSYFPTKLESATDKVTVSKVVESTPPAAPVVEEG